VKYASLLRLRPCSGRKLLARACALALAGLPAFAGIHAVNDFRPDFGGSTADSLNLDPAFGDTLLITPRLFQYKTLAPKNLTDSSAGNGKAGSIALTAATGPNTFKVAYVGWTAGQSPSPGIAATPPPGDIIMRDVSVDQGVLTVSPAATVIAGSENKTDPFSPRQFYGGGQQQQPAPTYLSFGAEGGNYVAYWSTLYPNGSVRRTTSRELSISSPLARGTYVFITPPNKPVVCQGYGELSSAIVPGSSGLKTVVAYEDTIVGVNNQIEVRWEDVGAQTSVALRFVRPGFPEDIAVAADSAGNSLILWHENLALYAAGYDAARTQVMAPVQLAAGIFIREGAIDHYYRPYSAVSTVNGTFLVAYGRNGNAKGTPIYLRSVTLPAGTLGAEAPATSVPDTCKFPSLAANARSVLVAWYETFADGTDSLIGALYDKQGAGINPASRSRMTLSPEAVSFSAVGSGWYIYHSMKTPGISMDSKGNIAVGYDNQFLSKLGFVTNTAIYYDSAVFTSKSLSATNPSVPSAYNANVDSLQFLSLRLATVQLPGKVAQYQRQIAVSVNGTFTDAGSGFVPFVDSAKTRAGNYRYRLVQRADAPNNFSQTKIDSLILRYNVKPRVPKIDSIRIGGGPMQAYSASAVYTTLPRRDTVRIVCSAVDIDDESLEFRVSLGATLIKAAAAARASAGNFKASIAFLPPDTALNPLPLSLAAVDPENWFSSSLTFPLDYRNRAPAETLVVIRSRGRDSGGVFAGTSGPRDTISPAAGQALPLQIGDVAKVNVRFGDPNDDSTTIRLVRNGVQLINQKVSVKDTLSIDVHADTLAPIVDTMLMIASDKDTSVTYKLLLRTNRLPAPDSVYLAAYRAKDLSWKTGSFDKIKDFAADTGLIVPSGLPAVLKAKASDPDKLLGDGARIVWSALKRLPGCAQGNLACYQNNALGAGDTLLHTFAEPEQYLLLRAVDSTGAFLEKRIRLEYPVLDTSASSSYASGLKSLSQDLDFVLESTVRERTVKVDVISQGNIPLQVASVATGANDQKWMGLKINWTKPGNLGDSVSLDRNTDANPLAPASPIVVAPGAKLSFTFRFFSDSLRGDSIFYDTLFLRTNDFANSLFKIPFKMVYNDLPVMRISCLGGQAASAGGYNDKGLPKLLPVRTSLVFGFSEPVQILNPYALIRIYSKLDSLKNPSGYKPIAGSFAYRLKPRGAPKGGVLPKPAAPGDSIADTLIFTPAYDRKSDSLKVLPKAGSFIHRDILHIAVSNGITDRADNTLDLRLDRTAFAANTVDTIFEARIDTGYVRVTSTTPAQGLENWDPDDNIRIHFNRKLLRRPPGDDSLTLLNLAALKGDSNHGVWVTSLNHPKHYDFALLALEDGDSTLVLRARPKFPARDTVTIHLSGGITDIDGLNLDGNGDGFPGYQYNPVDSSDAYVFSFLTLAQEFYIYPNPFRWQDPRHREKGSITFKNINSIQGFVPGREVFLRIYTMTGDLVYSSQSAPSAQAVFGKRAWTTLDWDLINNAGNLVGTGVYVYTLIMGESTVLKKGKVAVVR
jgi:hypothetical protein